MTTPPGFAVDGPLISSWPRILLQVVWTAGGNSSAPDHWYTLSSRLRGQWRATLSGRQYEMDAVQAGQMTFALDNLDGAFDPDNTSSFFYPYVLPYRRCRLVFQTAPTRNLLYQGIALGTELSQMAAGTGTTGTATGLSGASSGLSTAFTWAIPNATASGAVFGMAGATQSWATTASHAMSIVPNLPYSVGVDVSLAAGGMASLAIRHRLRFYDLNGNLLTSASNVATVTTSWSRITVTGTAPANAAFAVVLISNDATTTAATTVRATGWQIEQASAATSWVDPGPFAPIWSGFIERWPQNYIFGGKYGQVSVTAVDALAPLSQLKLTRAMPTYIDQQAPQYSFDLAAASQSPDVVNGTAFLDLGGSGAALDINGSAITTGVSISSTTPVGTLWNTPGPVITLTNNQASSLGNASGATYLTPWDGTDHIMLPSSGGWTRMICFRTTALPNSGGRYSVATLWAATDDGFLAGSGSNQDGAYLFINGSGNVGLNMVRSDGTNLATVNPTQVVDGNWHCAVVSLSADGKTVQVSVDGNGWFNTTATDLHGTYTQDNVGSLLVGASINRQPFNGDMAWFAQWSLTLSVAATLDISAGFATGWTGDEASNRLNRVMSLVGFNPTGVAGTYAFNGVDQILGGISMEGRSALDVVQESCDTGVDQVVMDANGIPTIYGHQWRWIQSVPTLTFGENTAGGEIPYLDDVEFEQDPAHLYNDVQVTVDGAADLTDTNALQEVSDATSQAAYFPQTLTRTVNPRTVQAGLNVANYLLSQYKDPHTRLHGLTIDLASAPGRLASVVGVKFADLVRVNRRPALAPSKALDCFIEQIEWSGDDTGKTLQLHLQMSPASQQRYAIISAAWAKLTASVAAGVSTVTVGPIQGHNEIAAQYVIPSGCGYQMTLGYGTANQETVTVLSVQTVTAGYSTVQITFTAPTTKSHSVNDYLCDPLPSNIVVPPGTTYPTCFDALSLTGGTSPLIGF